MLCIGYAKSVPDEGSSSNRQTATPHPSSLREAALSHKGRGEEEFGVRFSDHSSRARRLSQQLRGNPEITDKNAQMRLFLCLGTAGGAGGVVFGGIRWDRQLALHVHRLNPFDFTCEKRSHRSRLTLSAILALY